MYSAGLGYDARIAVPAQGVGKGFIMLRLLFDSILQTSNRIVDDCAAARIGS